MDDYESSLTKDNLRAFHTEFTEVFTEITEKRRRISPCPLCAFLCYLCVKRFISDDGARDVEGLTHA
jgi:hypothetical protein